MKKSILILITILCVSAVILTGCSGASTNNSSQDIAPGAAPEESLGVDAEGGGNNTVPDRKIIYTANLEFRAYNFVALKNKINSSLQEGEWFDQKSESGDGYAYYVARVKSERLQAFILSISEKADEKNVDMSAQDISLTYQSVEDRIDALNEEKALLIAYVGDNAALGLEVSKRVAQINSEIRALNNTLDRYDSLEEYSTVTIRVSKLYTQEELKYSEEAENTFYGAWRAFARMFEVIGLIIIAIFPFALVIAPVTVGTVFLVKIVKKKKKERNEKIEDTKEDSEE